MRLRPVQAAAERALWRAMLEQHHPQGAARAPGCRLSWLLESEAFGTLGGMSFVAAPMSLGPLDRWLAWSDRARGAHIDRIVSQDRFLLLPGVRVKCLASRALKLARQPLPGNQVLWKAWKIVQICVLREEARDPARHSLPRLPCPPQRDRGRAADAGRPSLSVPDSATVPAHPSIDGSDPES